MQCEDCKGTGESANKGEACFMCNGTGTVCDKCGEASEEEGMDVCMSCVAEEEAEA